MLNPLSAMFSRTSATSTGTWLEPSGGMPLGLTTAGPLSVPAPAGRIDRDSSAPSATQRNTTEFVPCRPTVDVVPPITPTAITEAIRSLLRITAVNPPRSSTLATARAPGTLAYYYGGGAWRPNSSMGRWTSRLARKHCESQSRIGPPRRGSFRGAGFDGRLAPGETGRKKGLRSEGVPSVGGSCGNRAAARGVIQKSCMKAGPTLDFFYEF
jgi:hypothetical protein